MACFLPFPDAACSTVLYDRLVKDLLRVSHVISFSVMERQITFHCSNLHVPNLEVKSASLRVSQEGKVTCSWFKVSSTNSQIQIYH